MTIQREQALEEEIKSLEDKYKSTRTPEIKNTLRQRLIEKKTILRGIRFSKLLTGGFGI